MIANIRRSLERWWVREIAGDVDAAFPFDTRRPVLGAGVFRVGMHKPRNGLGGDAALRTTSSPVLAPSWGKNSAPSGLVVTVRPTGEVRISVPSGS